MKKILMKYKIIIIIVIGLSILLAIDTNQYIKQYKENYKIAKEYAESSGEAFDDSLFPRENVVNMIEIYFNDGYFSVIQLVLPILFIVIGVKRFHSKIHSGYIKNELIRRPYSKVLIKEIILSYKGLVIIPIIVFMCFVFACLTTKFNFEITFTGENWYYVIMWIVNMLIIAISIINVGLILSRNNNNFIVTCLESFLLIFGYQVIAELVGSSILSKLTGDSFYANGLTFFAFWNGYCDGGVTPIKMNIYAFILTFISTIFVIFNYIKKEKVIIYAEK